MVFKLALGIRKVVLFFTSGFPRKSGENYPKGPNASFVVLVDLVEPDFGSLVVRGREDQILSHKEPLIRKKGYFYFFFLEKDCPSLI